MCSISASRKSDSNPLGDEGRTPLLHVLMDLSLSVLSSSSSSFWALTMPSIEHEEVDATTGAAKYDDSTTFELHIDTGGGTTAGTCDGGRHEVVFVTVAVVIANVIGSEFGTVVADVVVVVAGEVAELVVDTGAGGCEESEVEGLEESWPGNKRVVLVS